MPIYIRPAYAQDVEQITAMVNRYAAQNVMLPRTAESVQQTLGDWLVCVDEDEQENQSDPGEGADASPPDLHPASFISHSSSKVVGCGALVDLTQTLVEIRSLAIHEEYQGHGIGGQLVRGLIEMARTREFKQICALTLREDFFLRLGFELVDRWSISPKVWQACIYCPKFHHCDEVAVLMNLADQPLQVNVEELRKAGWNSLLRWGEWQPLRLAYQHKPGEHAEAKRDT
jgi:amino-acid N-acetyltransferase